MSLTGPEAAPRDRRLSSLYPTQMISWIHNLALIAAGMAVAAQERPATLTIAGGERTLTVTREMLDSMPRAKASIDHENVVTEFEGVWLDQLLAQVGAPLAGNLRGKAFATFVRAEANDGYQVVFSLAEIDPAFSENRVLLADRARGEKLIGSQGPFRLVVVKDKRPARSMRMVERIELVSARK
jgi:hypothetical protein